ncbi:hypothetical protein MMC34_001182 [Xylographa carneopallida]|nr:hypothetical protein [Xylographa carneopallida]
MAHHQHKRQERPLMAQVLSFFTRNPSDGVTITDEDEPAFDDDEPPDHSLVGKIVPSESYFKLPSLPTSHTESLLTQALLTSPSLRSPSLSNTCPPSRALSLASTHSNTSITSTAELTSDGGLTSPARTSTPSPPLPSSRLADLSIMTSKSSENTHQRVSQDHTVHSPINSTVTAVKSVNPEPSLARRRCITFACGGLGAKAPDKMETPKISEKVEETAPTKRSCMLRFACPSKSSTEMNGKPEKVNNKPYNNKTLSISQIHEIGQSGTRYGGHIPRNTLMDSASDRNVDSAMSLTTKPSHDSQLVISKEAKFKDVGNEDDAWMHETPRPRHKITVSDTLRKENAIRKLGEEAEEEALEEEEAEADIDEDAEDLDEDDYASDGGNESDDEEGFADSDDEEEVDPNYQFWTPRTSTAGVSTDQFEHIRHRPRRTASQSSVESAIQANCINISKAESNGKYRKAPRRRNGPKMRPGTPELPDSTDFVCGTLDEDRPLEAAYVSCLEQRKLAKRVPLPQDLDPSFPTSDPEDEEDDGDDAFPSDDNTWVTGRPDESDEGHRRGRLGMGMSKNIRSPAPSPRRLRSPAPPKRCGGHRLPLPLRPLNANRSPPPRQLFGHSPQHKLTPVPRPRNPISPPSSRRPSLSSSSGQKIRGIDMPSLAQRPNLTHTKSLPRTPNPFWSEHRRTRIEISGREDMRRSDNDDTELNKDVHSRGPIDIVQGLERKRQKRREKYWRQANRYAGKEKERRCQPGKGAERMRELGLEVADRNKAYGQRAQLVLSV